MDGVFFSKGVKIDDESVKKFWYGIASGEKTVKCVAWTLPFSLIYRNTVICVLMHASLI